MYIYIYACIYAEAISATYIAVRGWRIFVDNLPRSRHLRPLDAWTEHTEHTTDYKLYIRQTKMLVLGTVSRGDIEGECGRAQGLSKRTSKINRTCHYTYRYIYIRNLP